jgi:hypothetical protein
MKNVRKNKISVAVLIVYILNVRFTEADLNLFQRVTSSPSVALLTLWIDVVKSVKDY